MKYITRNAVINTVASKLVVPVQNLCSDVSDEYWHLYILSYNFYRNILSSIKNKSNA